MKYAIKFGGACERVVGYCMVISAIVKKDSKMQVMLGLVSVIVTSYPFVEVCAVALFVICTHLTLRYVESLQISENLIPQAARLILANTPKNRSDFVDQERSDSDDYDYVVTDDTDSEPEPSIPPPDYDNYVEDFRDSYGDYGKQIVYSLCLLLEIG